MNYLVKVFGLALFAGFYACAGAGPPLDIELKTPEAPDPFEGVVEIRLSIKGSGLPKQETTVPREASELSLSGVEPGDKRVIEVLGLNESSEVISAGKSTPFRLTDAEPEKVVIFFSRVNSFSTIDARLTTPRYDHTATVLPDDRVVIAGGSNDKVLSSVEVFDPVGQLFTTGEPLSAPRAGHITVLVDDGSDPLLVLVGGRGDGSPALASAEVYSAESGKIAEIALQRARQQHTATALADGTVLVTGGRDASGALLSHVELIDPRAATTEAVAPLSDARASHAAIRLDDGRVLVAGGEKAEGGGEHEFEASKKVEIYDPKTKTWSAGPSLPAERRRAVAVVLDDGRALLVGGDGEEQLGASTELLDASASRWTTMGNDYARLDHAVVVLAAGVLVAGGDVAAAEIFRDEAFVPAGSLVQRRQNLTLSVLPDNTALAVGGRDAGKVVVGAEVYIPR